MDAIVKFDFLDDAATEAAYAIVLLKAGKREAAVARFKRAIDKASK